MRGIVKLSARRDEVLPPAIVWGLDRHIGVNFVRELGRRGIPVSGLSGDLSAIRTRSSYLMHYDPGAFNRRPLRIPMGLPVTFRIPRIFKWADTNTGMAKLGRAGIEFKKVEYAYSAGEWIVARKRYEAIKAWPLIQEYCAGNGLGQFVFMHAGQALRLCQHIRIAEWPPEGEFSSMCDAVPLTEHRELQEKSMALLREMGWEGVAIVEYRYDAERGLASLMEIAGRHLGSFPLAVHCGAGFALYAYFITGLNRGLVLPEPRSDLRCRVISTEFKRPHRILFDAESILDRGFVRRPLAELVRFLAAFLRPDVRYYLVSSDDIWPLRRDMMKLLCGSRYTLQMGCWLKPWLRIPRNGGPNAANRPLDSAVGGRVECLIGVQFLRAPVSPGALARRMPMCPAVTSLKAPRPPAATTRAVVAAHTLPNISGYPIAVLADVYLQRAALTCGVDTSSCPLSSPRCVQLDNAEPSSHKRNARTPPSGRTLEGPGGMCPSPSGLSTNHIRFTSLTDSAVPTPNLKRSQLP